MAKEGKQLTPNEKKCIKFIKMGLIDSFNALAALEILLQHIFLSTSVGEPHFEVRSFASTAS